MHKKKKLIFSDESLDAIASRVHAKIDYKKIIQGVLNAIPKPKDGKDLILTEALRADFADQIATLLPAPKDGKDGKPGLSHQEKEQIRADITEKVQKDVKLPDIDDITKTLSDTFVTKGLLRNKMEALTRFIKQKTPVSAGISGGDMVDEITKVLGQDWQTGGGAVESVDGRIGIVTLGDLYEPLFSKNSAFNKNFGVGAGQVAEGNALAAKMTGPGSSQINEIFVAVDANGNAQMVPIKIDPATRKMTNLGVTEQDNHSYIENGKKIIWTSNGLSGGIERGSISFLTTLAIRVGGELMLSSNSIIVIAEKDFKVVGNLFVNTVKSGATQVAAGAAIHEVWKTSGHATLPDNVLMIGI